MKEEISDLDIALNKISDWKEIAHKLKSLPSAAEFERTYAELEASVAHDLEYDFGCDSVGLPPPSDSVVVDRPLPAKELPKTTKVSIRIPTATVMAFKEKSKVAKVGYQTLINRVLKAAAKV